MLHMHEQNQKLRLNLPESSQLHINRDGICSSLVSTIWRLSLNEQGFDLEHDIFKPKPQILALQDRDGLHTY